MANRNVILLRQLSLRVLTVLVATVVAAGLFVFALQHVALEKSIQTSLLSLQRHYQEKAHRLDQVWQGEAMRLHARLEAKNLFSGPDKGLDPLRASLRLEDRDTFPIITVQGADQKTIFQLANAEQVPDHFVAEGPSGWTLDKEGKSLFRWFRYPLWLGARGKGHLVLFVPMDNALLFHSAIPPTNLFLIYHGSVVASSLGRRDLPELTPSNRHEWHDGSRYDQITMPWGDAGEQGPRLLIRHRSAPLFSAQEIFGMGSLVLIGIALLFWHTLGSWGVRLAHRIAVLGKISREFSDCYDISPAMRHDLGQVRAGAHDEISDVADAMQHLVETVVHHHQELANRARELRESEESSRALTQSLRDIVLVFDAGGIVRFCNHVGIAAFGLMQGELIGRPVATLLSVSKGVRSGSRERQIHFPNDAEGLAGSGTFEGTARRADTTEFPVEISLSHWVRHDIRYFTAVVRDISEHKLLEARDLRAYVNRVAISALLEIGIESLPLHRKLEVALEIILTVPWLAVQYKGSIFLAIDNDGLDMVVQRGLPPHIQQGCRRLALGHCMCGRAAQSKKVEFSSQVDARHDGHDTGDPPHGHYCVPILSREKLLGVLNLYVDHGHCYDPEEDAFLVTIATTLAGLIERGMAEERVQFMANHDLLTGLPNRMLLRELLEREIRHAARYQKKLATGFVDLDHFKVVNDTLGHEAGDELLKAVAAKIREQLRDSDTLARLGGDEFVLILPAVNDLDGVLLVANKVIQALGQPFIIAGQPCHIGASIGISLYPEHGQGVDALLLKADRAMYAVKKSGRNHVVVYDAALDP
ncbi:MAG: diguanylate cyclase [Magnetococcales bacterium]|nr:diguanylate cyclase [Magnetococcales bacterium]